MNPRDLAAFVDITKNIVDAAKEITELREKVAGLQSENTLLREQLNKVNGWYETLLSRQQV